jgi:integrase
VKYFDVNFVYTTPEGIKDRHRKRLVNCTKADAKTYERETYSALITGRYKKEEETKETKETEEVPTFEDFAPIFLRDYVDTFNRKKERRAKRSHLKNHLLPYFGPKRLDQITISDIDQFISEKLTVQRLAPKTVKNIICTFRRLMKTAIEYGHIKTLPTIRSVKVPRKKPDYLKPDEVARLIRCAEPEWLAMIVTAAHTGMRLGELIALRWQDVDLENRQIIVSQNSYRGQLDSPKSNKWRTIQLSELVCVVLKNHQHNKSERVFCREDGEPITETRSLAAIKRNCRERAGLDKHGWHLLRHSCCSLLAVAGVVQLTIKKNMGHASITTSDKYMHWADEIRRSEIKKLDKFSGDLVNHVNNVSTKDKKQ